MQLKRYVAQMAALLGALLPHQSQAIGEPEVCLYGFNQGTHAAPVVACPDDDPLDLASDSRVKAVMSELGINPTKVRFSGCPSQIFRLASDAQGAATKYVVYYRSSPKAGLLAPLIHELAHVMQAEMAGGKENIYEQFSGKPDKSRRVELGADYLTGVIFARLFTNLPLKEFEQNLTLVGLYVESPVSAHGTQEQRESAFALGTHMTDPRAREIRDLNRNFQKNQYGSVILFNQ